MSKKVIVIGAGIAGLTAAIYARRSGFDVTLIERHTIPGGMCTSWKRKGYLFEGAVHWLTGSSPKAPINRLWREVGALGGDVKLLHHDPFLSLAWEDATVCLYRNIEKTAAHFLALSPQDAGAIARLVKDVKALSKVQMPVMDIKGVTSAHPVKMGADMLKMLPALPRIGRLGRLSVEEYTERFRHPALRRLMGYVVPPGYNASALLFTLATLHNGDGGYPNGGSLPMTRRMADTFTALGGELRLGTRVKKVVVKNGAAVGVELENEALPADAVIVTQETIAAIHSLFDTPPQDTWLQELGRNTKPMVCTFVSVGVRAAIPETPVFILPEPIVCGGLSYDALGFNNYTGYSGYAPEGCTALTTALLGDSYAFWKAAKDEGRYESEKQAVAGQINRALCARFPQAEGKVDVIDIATPLTYERYTGAYHGSWMSFTGKGDGQKQYPGSLDSIKGVYFAGHRMTSPGGLPVALVSGRRAAQMVCRRFGAVFQG